VYSS
jgi:hypothetical protein